MQLKQELSVLISNCDVVGIRGGAVTGRGAVVDGEKKTFLHGHPPEPKKLDDTTSPALWRGGCVAFVATTNGECGWRWHSSWSGTLDMT